MSQSSNHSILSVVASENVTVVGRYLLTVIGGMFEPRERVLTLTLTLNLTLTLTLSLSLTLNLNPNPNPIPNPKP